MGEKIVIGVLIMLKGMLGIFTVSVFLIIAILLMNLFTGRTDNR